MSRPGIKPGPPLWEASTLEKSHTNSVFMAIWHIYIWARNQWRMLATWLPPVHVLHEHTWTHMNCTRIRAKYHLQGISKQLPAVKQDRSCRGSPPWKDLTIHPKLEVPGLRFLSRASMVGGEHSRNEPLEQLVNFFIIGVEEFLENKNPKYRPRIKGE
jgi:hypothetical protein